MAAWDKRIFEGLGTRSTALVGVDAGLYVVYLEVGREANLGSVHEGDIALAGNGYQQRCGVVGLERIAAHTGLQGELSHTAAEACRSPGREGTHAQYGCLRNGLLTGGNVVVLEEVVKEGSAPAAAFLVHQAHYLGRLYALAAGLLGNDNPAAQDGAVIHSSAQLFPLELYVLGSLHFLAPKAVEGREFGIFETHQVGTVVNLQGNCHRFANHNLAAAQGELQEKGLRRGRCLRARLTLRCSRASRACTLRGGKYLYLNGFRAYGLAFHRRICGSEGEGSGGFGLKDIGV